MMVSSPCRRSLASMITTGLPKVSSCNHSSLSAMAYKTLHRNTKRPPLPVIETPNWSTNAAISSILSETPITKSQVPSAQKLHILNCLVQNEPGVLSRISGTLAGRGFNIESLVVSNTEVKDLSRMTIVLQGLDGIIEQARRQIEDLVPVWAVLNYTAAPVVKREILLAKVSLLGPEYFQKLLEHHNVIYKHAIPRNIDGFNSIADNYDNGSSDNAHTIKSHHPNHIAPSEALRHKHEHLKDITALAHLFGGKIADVSERNCIIELCAKPERVTNFLELLQPFGVLELARTGMTALLRTPFDSAVAAAAANSEFVHSASDVVDATNLPPG